MIEPQKNVAKVMWNPLTYCYELRVLNILKAVTTGIDRAAHDAARPQIIALAKDKGYTVINVENE